MSSLRTTVDRLRRRIRLLLMVRGWCRVLSIVLVLFAAAAALDWMLPIDNPIVRLLLMWSIGFLGLVLSLRQVFGPWLMPLSDSALSLWVEQQDASWRDRLASAVAFETEVQHSLPPALTSRTGFDADPRGDAIATGSQNDVDGTLRRQVVESVATDRRLDRIPQLASPRAALWPAFLLMMILLSMLGVVAAKPAQCEIVWERFASPWSGREWPRRTQLQLRDADWNLLPTEQLRCVADEPLTLYVTNSQGELPADMICEQRTAEGAVEEVAIRLTTLKDDAGVERTYGVVNLHPREGELLVRARGGDDREMLWHRFEVVAALRLEAFRVTVTPPQYTALPAETTLSGVAHVEGLVGSRVRIQGTSNRPLSSVVRMQEGMPGEPGTLMSEGTEFEVTFSIEREGRTGYWFELQDEYGLDRARPVRYEIVGRVDQPPTIEVSSPLGLLTATTVAELPLSLKGQDDLGIARIVLKIPGSDRRREQEWLLYTMQHDAANETAATALPRLSGSATGGLEKRNGDSSPSAGELAVTGATPSESLREGERPLRVMEIDRVWSLESLQLPPGETIEYFIEMTDIKAPVPNSIRSTSGSLTILSSAEKRRELLARQGGMRQLIERLLLRHRPAQQVVGELLTQATTVGELRLDDLSLVRQAEQENRRILADLSDARSGLGAQVTGLLDELRWNKIVDPPTVARMQRFQPMIVDLAERHLTEVRQSLATVRRRGGGESGTGVERDIERSRSEEGAGSDTEDSSGRAVVSESQGKTLVESLRAAQEAQQIVTTSLEAMLAELGEWEQRRDVSSGLSELLAAQEHIHDETRSTATRTLSRRLEELEPQDRADLARLADRQRQLTHRLRDLTDNLNRDGPSQPGATSDLDPRLSELADRLRTAGIEGDFNSAARAIETNAVGDAASLQQRVISQLTALNQLLREQERQDIDSRIEAIRQVQDETETLRKKQEQLHNDVATLRPMSEDPDRSEQLQRLQKRQQELMADLSTLQTKLYRLGLPRATAPAARTAARMADANRALETGDGATAVKQQQESLDDLQQLEQSLAEAEQQAAAAQRQQELAGLSSRLTVMQQSQQALHQQTIGLQTTLDAGERWNRTQLKEVRDLAVQQRALAVEVAVVANKLQQMTLIHTSLEQARGGMEEASQLLDERNTDGPTQTAQTTAIRWLERLQHALDADANAQSTEPMPPGTPGETGPQSPTADGQTETLVMELRLLREMLADLSTETAKLAENVRVAGRTDELEQRRQQLSIEQSVLTELSAKLLEPLLKSPSKPALPAAETPADNPPPDPQTPGAV